MVASHDPQGLLLIDETEGGFEAGELLATEALPYGVISYDVTNDLNRDLLVALGSGHLGVWRATDAGLADPVLIEIGPDPRRIAGGVIGWTEQPVIAVTTGETVSMLVPDP